MYKEFRDVTLNGAVDQLYTEMASLHRIRAPGIQIVKTATVQSNQCKREKVTMMHVSPHCPAAIPPLLSPRILPAVRGVGRTPNRVCRADPGAPFLFCALHMLTPESIRGSDCTGVSTKYSLVSSMTLRIAPRKLRVGPCSVLFQKHGMRGQGDEWPRGDLSISTRLGA